MAKKKDDNDGCQVLQIFRFCMHVSFIYDLMYVKDILAFNGHFFFSSFYFVLFFLKVIPIRSAHSSNEIQIEIDNPNKHQNDEVIKD